MEGYKHGEHTHAQGATLGHTRLDTHTRRDIHMVGTSAQKEVRTVRTYTRRNINTEAVGHTQGGDRHPIREGHTYNEGMHTVGTYIRRDINMEAVRYTHGGDKHREAAGNTNGVDIHTMGHAKIETCTQRDIYTEKYSRWGQTLDGTYSKLCTRAGRWRQIIRRTRT